MSRRRIRIRRVGRLAESDARIGRRRSQLYASEIHRSAPADAHRRQTRRHSGRRLPQQRRRLGQIHRVRHVFFALETIQFKVYCCRYHGEGVAIDQLVADWLKIHPNIFAVGGCCRCRPEDIGRIKTHLK